MGKVSLVHFAASVGFRSDDVIFGIRKVKPVLGTRVDLEADLGSPIILRNALAHYQISHLTFVVRGYVKRVPTQAAKRRSNPVWTQAHPVAAGEQIEVSQFLLQDHAIKVDRT